MRDTDEQMNMRSNPERCMEDNETCWGEQSDAMAALTMQGESVVDSWMVGNRK